MSFFACNGRVCLLCCNLNQKRATGHRKTKEELLKMAPEDLFMELIRDIANELNVNQLCHKILVNVCVLVSYVGSDTITADYIKSWPTINRAVTVHVTFNILTRRSNYYRERNCKQDHSFIRSFIHSFIHSAASCRH